jgi:hypothetical protein
MEQTTPKRMPNTKNWQRSRDASETIDDEEEDELAVNLFFFKINVKLIIINQFCLKFK